MGKNGYLERQKQAIEIYRQAEKDTQIQYMADLFILTLNDPKVMGKDVFGRKRILRVIKAVQEKYDLYIDVLTKNPESDYMQEKLDKQLGAIIGEENLTPFAERYEWIAKNRYDRKQK